MKDVQGHDIEVGHIVAIVNDGKMFAGRVIELHAGDRVVADVHGRGLCESYADCVGVLADKRLPARMETVMSIEFKPGVYRHYKGNYYRALFLARHSEHRDEQVVVYMSLAHGTIWVRPYIRPLVEGDDCWTDLVNWPDGVQRQRFRYVGNEVPQE